jgi:hypothetical protein
MPHGGRFNGLDEGRRLRQHARIMAAPGCPRTQEELGKEGDGNSRSGAIPHR